MGNICFYFINQHFLVDHKIINNLPIIIYSDLLLHVYFFFNMLYAHIFVPHLGYTFLMMINKIK